MFIWVILFLKNFLLSIYFMKHTRYLLYIKIDHAPLIILIFLFETFKNYYFLNSSIPLLRGCLHKIPFQAK